MAAKSRRSVPPLIEELRNRPYRFDFYQAVRIVELHHGVGVDPDSPLTPIGEGADPRKEAVRFTSDPSLAFPPSSIKSYTPRDGARPDDMTIRFMGLAGALGPLPRPFTEKLLRRNSKKDTAWQAFLDIFNHRFASLMARVRKTHRLGLDTAPPERTLMAKFLRAFIGIGTDGLQNRMAVDDRALLRYAGLFAHKPRTAVGLESLLRDHFGAAFEVRQFDGAWIHLEDDQPTRLGGRLGGLSGRNNTLGDTAVLGGRYWDQHAGIELRIGPMDRESFESFLPNGSRHSALLALVMFYVSPEYDFSARLVAAPEAVPECRLGGDLRLGWTSWLRSSAATAEDTQVAIRVRGQWALEKV